VPTCASSPPLARSTFGADQYRWLYPELRSRAIDVDVDGLSVVVVSRNDLIRLKAGTGRDRDLLDIGDLLALDE